MHCIICTYNCIRRITCSTYFFIFRKKIPNWFEGKIWIFHFFWNAIYEIAKVKNNRRNGEDQLKHMKSLQLFWHICVPTRVDALNVTTLTAQLLVLIHNQSDIFTPTCATQKPRTPYSGAYKTKPTVTKHLIQIPTPSMTIWQKVAALKYDKTSIISMCVLYTYFTSETWAFHDHSVQKVITSGIQYS